MREYDYQRQLKNLWEWAVAQYRQGNRDPESYDFLNLSERQFLSEIGLRPHDLFDFAEDYVRSGEPDFTTFAMIADVRRRYLNEVQEGQGPDEVIDVTDLPSREEQVAGITWLPRLIAKARGRLHGDLHPDVSFPCPMDRQFLRKHDIHPVEVLNRLWESEKQSENPVRWFLKRIHSSSQVPTLHSVTGPYPLLSMDPTPSQYIPDYLESLTQ